MDTKGELYQTVTLIIIVLIVDMLERNRPGRTIDRRLDLRLNVLALLVVIFSGELIKTLLVNFFKAFNIAELLAVAGITSIPGVLRIIVGVIVVDFCLYWIHRGMHRKRVLWRTHAFHHSLKEVWWLSGSRTSVTHLFLFAIPQVLFAYVLLKLSPDEVTAAFSIGIVVNVWIHANLSVDLGPMEWLLITPNFHRVHHGAGRLAGQNLGFVLTIWDRIFGTYVDPKKIDQDFAIGSVPVRDRLPRMIAGV